MSLKRLYDTRAQVLRPWQLWWAMRIGLWLCGLPIRLRLYSLPGLLQRLTPRRGRQAHCQHRELELIVALVVQMCQRWPLRVASFPRACLRQALTLYYVLTRLGYPVTLHFGVAKVGEVLDGHSWVTVAGQPVAERRPLEPWQIVYTYPSAAAGGPCDARAP